MISKEQLTKSEVTFDEVTHTYTLFDRQLSGITGLIHSVLRLGIYPDADLKTKEVRIPNAARYGKAVHRMISEWEDLGFVDMTVPQEVLHTEHYGDVPLDELDLTADFDAYQRTKPEDMRCIASEFTVSYGQYASQIDAVWGNNKGDVYLVDHKTNNLDFYPGGKDGLKCYLSWQLSCYALMFEIQTGLKVTGLYCDHIRHGEGELWEITRLPDAQIFDLLDTEAVLQGDGTFRYVNEAMQADEQHPTVTQWLIPQADTYALAAIVQEIAEIKRQADEAKKREEGLKQALFDAMQAAGVKSWDAGMFKATIRSSKPREGLDTKQLAADLPEVYAKYKTETAVKPSLLITLAK